MIVLALACAPKTPAEPASPAALGSREPIAGPRNVVEQAPPPPVGADVPGQGPMQPWLSRLRAAVGPGYASCAEGLEPAPAVPLVVARIAEDGALRDVDLLRSSGDLAWDACLVKGFRSAPLPPPPAELVVDGELVTPTLAFSPPPAPPGP